MSPEAAQVAYDDLVEDAWKARMTQNVISEIAAERRRQIEAEGWTPEHDDAHAKGELAKAAACYAAGSKLSWSELRHPSMLHGERVIKHLWPWDAEWWKPKDRRRDLIRAGALIVAEIERLDRAAAQPQE